MIIKKSELIKILNSKFEILNNIKLPKSKLPKQKIIVSNFGHWNFGFVSDLTMKNQYLKIFVNIGFLKMESPNINGGKKWLD
jgi:hypothetical protein